jgi:hypothetical protein
MFNRPAAGQQLMAVTVTVHNGEDRPGPMDFNLGLLTPSGVKLTEKFMAGVPRFDRYAQLQPGGSMTGELVYEVPVADAATVVLIAEPTLTLDTVKDQRFLALS